MRLKWAQNYLPIYTHYLPTMAMSHCTLALTAYSTELNKPAEKQTQLICHSQGISSAGRVKEKGLQRKVVPQPLTLHPKMRKATPDGDYKFEFDGAAIAICEETPTDPPAVVATSDRLDNEPSWLLLSALIGRQITFHLPLRLNMKISLELCGSARGP